MYVYKHNGLFFKVMNNLPLKAVLKTLPNGAKLLYYKGKF